MDEELPLANAPEEQEETKERIRNLKKLYKSYPEPLHLRNLVPVFRQRIEETIMPFVERLPDCELPEVTVSGQNDVPGIVKTPGTLTVSVMLNINSQDIPYSNIGVLSVRLFRPECDRVDFYRQVSPGSATAVPLDAPMEQIRRLIEYQLQHSQLEVFTEEDRLYSNPSKKGHAP